MRRRAGIVKRRLEVFYRLLKSLDEIERKEISLLGEVFGAHPVGSLNGLLRLIKKAANLIGHVLLGGVQVAAVGPMKIFACGGDILIGLLLKLRLIGSRNLR